MIDIELQKQIELDLRNLYQDTVHPVQGEIIKNSIYLIEQLQDEILTLKQRICALKFLLREPKPPEDKDSCNKTCSQSDWYKGGKCDKNGCYNKPPEAKS